MITGADTILIGAGASGPAIQRFLDDWSLHWRHMRIAVTGVLDSAFVSWSDARPSVPVEEGEVMVARDDEMEQGWDEYGYKIPGSEEGPFSILYQPCPVQTFSVAVKADPYARGDLFKFEEYDATVVGVGLSLITVVTPDLDSEFSKNVIKRFISSFRRGGMILGGESDIRDPGR